MRIPGKRELTFDRVAVMGILNVTPDSFSDGGLYHSDGALKHALEMVDAGADVIDIGGESTRPGSDPVSEADEIERVVPVIRELSAMTDVPISVDTMKARVAEAALDAGADMVNDVNGLRSPGMLDLIASTGVPVIIMHMNGTPKTMQRDLVEGSVTGSIKAFLKERVDAAIERGVKEIITDPGIGFGKTVRQNMEIVDNASEFSLGFPVLIAASRKRFLSETYPGMDRDEATAQVSMRAISHGADMVRVHNVPLMKRAISGTPL